MGELLSKLRALEVWAKIVDEPPPEARELAPRSQIATQFKLSAGAVGDAFIGYALLGTGERIYSVPATPEPGLGEAESSLVGPNIVGSSSPRGL